MRKRVSVFSGVLFLFSCSRVEPTYWMEPHSGIRFVKIKLASQGKALWVGETEVTQKQWIAIMGPKELHPEKPSPFFKINEQFPKVSVSYNDVQSYIAALKSKTDRSFRLPTAEEFQWLCASGEKSTPEELKTIAHYKDSKTPSLDEPIQAGSLTADANGLYDLQGNAYEWTSSNYFEIYPRQTKDSLYSNHAKILKGGSWAFGSTHTTCSNALPHEPEHWGYSIGFRLVFEEESSSIIE